MESSVVLGIDIGGTSIKLGAILGSKILESEIIRNTFKGRQDDFILEIKDRLEYYIEKYDIYKIGVGCPGIIKDGVVEIATNLGFENYDLKGAILKQFKNCIVKVENDGYVACEAEIKYGYFKDCNNGIFVTIGRGVGGAIIVDNKIIKGANGKGGNFGHMVIHTNGRRCSCGRKGCFETYASASGLIKTMKEVTMGWKNESERIELDKISGMAIAKLASENNKIALTALKKWNNDILTGLLDLCLVFDPYIIVIAGGITEGNLLNLKEIEKGLADFGYPNVKVYTAKYKGKTGLVGAGALVN